MKLTNIQIAYLRAIAANPQHDQPRTRRTVKALGLIECEYNSEGRFVGYHLTAAGKEAIQ